MVQNTRNRELATGGQNTKYPMKTVFVTGCLAQKERYSFYQNESDADDKIDPSDHQ